MPLLMKVSLHLIECRASTSTHSYDFNVIGFFFSGRGRECKQQSTLFKPCLKYLGMLYVHSDNDIKLSSTVIFQMSDCCAC